MSSGDLPRPSSPRSEPVQNKEYRVPGIIWLASYPKSGNTWLRVFLANMISGSNRPVSINDLPNFALGDNNLSHYRDFTGRDPSSLVPEDLARLRPRIHEWFARARQHDVFVKTHNAVLQAEGTPLITPSVTAGAIYVVRNPLDVAVSFAHHFELPVQKAVNGLCSDTFQLAATNGHLPQYLSSWSKHVRSWLDAPGLMVHCLRYEDMAERPFESFGEVSQFLGLDSFLGLESTPIRLQRAIEFSEFKRLADEERSAGFIEARREGLRFFREGRSGIWQETLTPGQVEQIVGAHGPTMARLGYLDSTGNPVA